MNRKCEGYLVGTSRANEWMWWHLPLWLWKIVYHFTEWLFGRSVVGVPDQVVILHRIATGEIRCFEDHEAVLEEVLEDG
jgi:hypothetical protein